MSSPVSWEDYATGPSECAPEWSWAWDGLVGLWVPALGPTGNALFDLSGRNNHGALTNMDPATDWVGSEYGAALDFDGGDDYIACSNSQQITTNFTAFGLFCPRATNNSGTSTIIQVAEGSSDWCRFGIIGNATTGTIAYPRLYLRVSGAVNTYTFSGASVALGQWGAFVYVYDGTNCKAWLNGVYAGSVVANCGATLGPVWMGNIINGQIAASGLVERAWGEEEIRAWSADPLGLLRPAQQSPAWWYSPGTPPASSIAAIHDYYRRLRCA